MTTDITGLVAELRADLAKMADGEREFWTAKLTPLLDALTAQAAELVEAGAENERLRERIASEQAWTAAARMRADENWFAYGDMIRQRDAAEDARQSATRSRDEALAALKVAEEALGAEQESQDAFLAWAYDTLKEINVSNYDHDDACELNAASVEVILAIKERRARSALENSKARLADATHNPGTEQREAGV